MSSIWGDNIKISVFGESHGKAIGVNIDGLPSGIELDLHAIDLEMKRRAPGLDELTTRRVEEDKYEIISGYFNGKTTGTPLCSIIQNKDVRSKDYSGFKDLIRPGHADYTGNKRYGGHNDFRGGGHFSGRLTAPLCFAGAIAKQILSQKDIIVGSHVKSIGNINDESFNGVDIPSTLLKDLKDQRIPTIKSEKSQEMKKLILKTRKDGDSVGGVVEIAVLNVLAGLGSPLFDSIESKIGSLLFSVPAVKGIEFGEGFDIAKMKGSEANDEFYVENEEIKTYSNNNGGVLGGISNGMPIVFKVAIKPTPSIFKTQRTVDLKTMENTEINIGGRHDSCIVTRIVPVLEAVTALAILDLDMGLNR